MMVSLSRAMSLVTIFSVALATNMSYSSFLSVDSDNFEPRMDLSYNNIGDDATIDVYVIDSGYNFHAELPDNVANVTSVDLTEPSGSNNQFKDCNAHGTPVSSILAEETNSSRTPINLYVLKVFGCESSLVVSSVAIYRALGWVAENISDGRPSIVNMSLSFSGQNTILAGKVQDLIDMGAIIVTSAGNNGDDACALNPGKMEGVIAVGNIRVKPSNNESVMIESSNFGDCVDIYSKGTFICQVAENVGQSCSGTSFAAPVVSAIAASYLHHDPTLTSDNILALLLSNAEYSVQDEYYYIMPSEATIDKRHYQIPAGLEGKKIGEINEAKSSYKLNELKLTKKTVTKLLANVQAPNIQ